MSKRQLIDEIRAFNPTAEVQFLQQFDEKALSEYLDHLQMARERSVRIRSWSRRTSTMRLVS